MNPVSTRTHFSSQDDGSSIWRESRASDFKDDGLVILTPLLKISLQKEKQRQRATTEAASVAADVLILLKFFID